MKIINLVSIFIVLFVIGCNQITQTEPYIATFQQDPNVIRQSSEFTLLYNVKNPKTNPDEVYLQVTILQDSRNCITITDYKLNQGKIPLGEIPPSGEKSFYTNFRTQDQTEGKECFITFSLYPTQTATNPTFTTTVKVNIARRTG